MDVTISAGFSSRSYDARLRIYTIESNIGGNYSRYHGDRYGYSRVGGGSYNNDAHTVNSWVAGYGYGAAAAGWFKFAPGDYAGKTIGWGSWNTGAVGHDGNGYLNFTSRIQVPSLAPFGSADTGDVWMSADRIPKAPGAPTPIGLDQITTTGMRYRFSGTTDGGAAINGWQAQYSTTSDFSSGVVTVSSNGTTTVNTLLPATRYYWRSRGSNVAVGWGPWSATSAATTLPATAPLLAVVPAPTGDKATVFVSPPGAITGVQEYRVSVSPPIGAGITVIRIVSPLTSQVVTGLIPGTTYTWSAVAIIDAYTSPASPPLAITQPIPGASGYYDGSTPDRADVFFTWDGTTDASTTTATGRAVTGWSVAIGAGVNSSGVLQQVTGGRSGAFCARVIVKQDAQAAGIYVGGNATVAGARSDVTGDADYAGAIYVRPSRAQRMQAEIVWFDASGTEITRVQGTAQNVTSTTAWTQLPVAGHSPILAVTAVVRIHDVTGTGWSAWLAGETFDVDDMQLNLFTLAPWFSGSTPDSDDWTYEWIGTAEASASRRLPSSGGPDPLIDPDCPPMPDPPAVPSVPADCIDDVGLWRRYSISMPASVVRRWSATIPTLVITTIAQAERQVRIRYVPNPDGLAPSQLDSNNFVAEQILSYVPPVAEITLDGVTQQVWATVGTRAPVSADRLLFGTDGAPASWPELTCGDGFVIFLDTPLDSPIGNIAGRLLVTYRQ